MPQDMFREYIDISWDQLKPDDKILVFIAAVTIVWYFWGGFTKTNDIPLNFWYEVPQASDDQQAFRQRKAEARNVANLFKEKVRQDPLFNSPQQTHFSYVAERRRRRILGKPKWPGRGFR